MTPDVLMLLEQGRPARACGPNAAHMTKECGQTKIIKKKKNIYN